MTTRIPAACCLVLLLAPCPGLAGEVERPLLVAVDDLPLMAGSLHSQPLDRERVTRGMLAALERHEVPAVGLVTWGNVSSPSDIGLLELWLEAGHELGSHGSRHLSPTGTSVESFVADAEEGRRELGAVLERHGRQLRFFRVPMLREGETPDKLESLRGWLATAGLRDLPVTIDSQDWSYERPWVEANRAGDGARLQRIVEWYHEAMHLAVRHHESSSDGLLGRVVPQVLLLHAGAIGAAEWDALFTWLTAAGHRFATVDEVLADPAFSMAHSSVGPRGPGLWDRMISERRAHEARAEVEAVLQRQAAAWNRGDLEAFVSAYAEDALFATPSGLTRGRDEVLRRYRGRYPDAEAMGRLSLEVLDLRLARGIEESVLGATPSLVHGASVVARWTLRQSRPDAEPRTGLTLIVLSRVGDDWLVVQDASM